MCYAACFAAKEATLKALGIGVADLGILREVEIERQPGGAYAVVLHRRTRSQARELGVRRVKLAVARSKKQTAAMAVLES